MFAADQRVKALVKIQSDDRTINETIIRELSKSTAEVSGMDDGTPIVPAGTEGTIIGKSEDSLGVGAKMKSDDCWLVNFDGDHFDVSETEMELV